MANQPASADTSSSSPVSYQTAFWTLIPLAISTMTQPSGRVLGSSPSYRTYLRSSPILCFVDAVFFILRLALSPFVLRMPVRQAISITIRERYRDVESPIEGIQYLENQTWLRWLWFVVGSLGPAIKLAAMNGVPWTKTWGMMFLGAFVVFESMIFFKRKDEGEGLEPFAYEEAASIPTLVLGCVNAEADTIHFFEQILFGCVVVGHSFMLFVAAMDFWSLRRPTYQGEADPWGYYKFLPQSVIPRTILVSLTIVLIIGFSFYTLGYTLRIFLISTSGDDLPYLLADKRAFSLYCIIFSNILIFVLEFGVGDTKNGFILAQIFDHSLLFLTFMALPLLGLLGQAISWLCSKYPALSVNLLMVPEAIRGSRPPSGAVWIFLFFISNVTVCTLWYRLRYDPTGTVNPSWTSVFG